MTAEEAIPKPADWIPGARSHDENEQLKSVIWFHRQRSAGLLDEFAGKYVAIHGTSIIDSDLDEPVLIQRLYSQHTNKIIVIQRVSGPDDPSWKVSNVWPESD